MQTTNSTTGFLLPEEKRFKGDKFPTFKLDIITGVKARGLLGYLDGSTTKPKTAPIVPPTSISTPGAAQSTALPPEPTSVRSTYPSTKEWESHNDIAFLIIYQNIDNPIGLGVKTDGTAHKAWQSLLDGYDIVSDDTLDMVEKHLRNTMWDGISPLPAHFVILR